LTGVYNWFKEHIRFIYINNLTLHSGFTARLFANSKYRDRILSLLKSADIGVADARIDEAPVQIEELKKQFSPAVFADMESRGVFKDATSAEINLTHNADGTDPVALDFEKEESEGTRRLFSLAGPWADILDNGYTVFIDEIETSLHPSLVKELLKLIFSGATNKKGAQAVFTTHNPVLLDNTIMRRDQIWFTEKSLGGATCLYPLTDYKPRNDEPLAKGYLAGRYGGIPFLPEGLKL
jgi:hypothetical protein